MIRIKELRDELARAKAAQPGASSTGSEAGRIGFSEANSAVDPTFDPQLMSALADQMEKAGEAAAASRLREKIKLHWTATQAGKTRSELIDAATWRLQRKQEYTGKVQDDVSYLRQRLQAANEKLAKLQRGEADIKSDFTALHATAFEQGGAQDGTNVGTIGAKVARLRHNPAMQVNIAEFNKLVGEIRGLEEPEPRALEQQKQQKRQPEVPNTSTLGYHD